MLALIAKKIIRINKFQSALQQLLTSRDEKIVCPNGECLSKSGQKSVRMTITLFGAI
jgi:hypothetical protein